MFEMGWILEGRDGFILVSGDCRSCFYLFLGDIILVEFFLGFVIFLVIWVLVGCIYFSFLVIGVVILGIFYFKVVLYVFVIF